MTKSRLRSVKGRNSERKKQAPRGQAAKRRSRRPAKQPNATKAFHNRLAVIFDFDDTLAPVSTHALLKRYGIDPKTFDRKGIQPLRDEGWDEKLAEFYCLIKESKHRPDRPITREFLAEVGRAIEPFEGVPEMFGRVRDCARRQISDIELEFYLLSCGFLDLERAVSFAAAFKQMWGSEFAFNDRGEIEFPKQILTHPEKVRYILQLSKGLGLEGQNRPLDVYRDVPDESCTCRSIRSFMSATVRATCRHSGCWTNTAAKESASTSRGSSRRTGPVTKACVKDSRCKISRRRITGKTVN